MQTSKKVLGSNPVNCIGLDVAVDCSITVNTFPHSGGELNDENLANNAKTKWLLGPIIKVKMKRQHSDIVLKLI